MRFQFHYRAPFTKQLALLDAVKAGAAKHGDEVVGEQGFDEVRDVDGLVLFGIGGNSREVFDAYQRAGKHVVFWDKGYTRGGGWFRVAVNSFQPLDALQREWPADRFKALGINLPWYSTRGRCILFDGASNKFCLWQGLGDWIDWGARLLRTIRAHTDLPIVYRPRPSHNNELEKARLAQAAESVRGVEFSDGPLAQDFARAQIVVSYGGNIGWEAALHGLAHFAIGDSIARPISETEWSRVGRPYIPTERERREWAQAVAYQQWTLPEIASGEAWRHIRGML